MFYRNLLSVLLICPILSIFITSVNGETCLVPHNVSNGDDTAAILTAFQRCGKNGKIIFEEHKTYNVGQIMNTTNLLNCEIDLKGTLLVYLLI